MPSVRISIGEKRVCFWWRDRIRLHNKSKCFIVLLYFQDRWRYYWNLFTTPMHRVAVDTGTTFFCNTIVQWEQWRCQVLESRPEFVFGWCWAGFIRIYFAKINKISVRNSAITTFKQRLCLTDVMIIKCCLNFKSNHNCSTSPKKLIPLCNSSKYAALHYSRIINMFIMTWGVAQCLGEG